MSKPKSRDALTDYFKKLGPQGRNSILNEGMGNCKRDKLHELHHICMDDVATDVSNGFSEEWKALKCIHPEHVSFLHLDNFSDLMTEMKNTFDILKSNLSQSGTQESGEILDTTGTHPYKAFFSREGSDRITVNGDRRLRQVQTFFCGDS
jgi:hypothetical protein